MSKAATSPHEASPEYSCSHWCTICSASGALQDPRISGLQHPVFWALSVQIFLVTVKVPKQELTVITLRLVSSGVCVLRPVIITIWRMVRGPAGSCPSSHTVDLATGPLSSIPHPHGTTHRSASEVQPHPRSLRSKHHPV